MKFESRTGQRSRLLWRRLQAVALGAQLDQRLAEGTPPCSDPALAIRAQQLTSPRGRQRMVKEWNSVLAQAGTRPVPGSPRMSLCRGRIRAADLDIRAMLMVADGPLPIQPRGAAMARLLLTDGTGPLHNVRSASDLDAAVKDATRQMKSVPAMH